MFYKSKLNTKIFWIVLNLIVISYCLIPLLWIISISLKPISDIADGRYIPKRITFENYKHVLSLDIFQSALVNSIVIALITAIITVIIAVLVSYSVVRINFKGKLIWLAIILIINMFPQISLVAPLFKIETTIGIFDTWVGLILPYVTFALPIAIYVLIAFFRDIPWELESAAIVDGATLAQAFRKIILPIVIPGIISAGILVFIYSWNDLLLAMSLTASKRATTAPVTIANFTGASEFEEPTGTIAAAATLITIPVCVFVISFQRKIVAGLTSGAVKG